MTYQSALKYLSPFVPRIEADLEFACVEDSFLEFRTCVKGFRALTVGPDRVVVSAADASFEVRAFLAGES